MPRKEYVQQLQEVQDRVLLIGSMVEKAVQRSVEALSNRDPELSRQIIDEDDLIDEHQLRLEELAIDVIATQQPMAGDLRVLVTALHVASELERVGDYAEGIAKISLMMGTEPPVKPLIDIPRMAEIGVGMLRDSLDALVAKDVEKAMEVWRRDDEVDALYAQIYRELLSFMVEDPRLIRRATHLLWVSHNLERIADRATNIAERVIYVSTGTMPTIEKWPMGPADAPADSGQAGS